MFLMRFNLEVKRVFFSGVAKAKSKNKAFFVNITEVFAVNERPESRKHDFVCIRF